MTLDPLALAIAGLLGAVTGAGYLALLWLSVRHLARSSRPILWLGGGAVVRLALVFAALALIMDGAPERLLAGLAGFLVVRLAGTRLTGVSPAPGTAR